MKRLAVIFLIAGFVLTGTAMAGEVSQGKCIQYNNDQKVLTIEEYDINFSKEAPHGKPTGIVSEFDCSKAKIGLKPEPGDIVRIAYDIKSDKKIAVKVMNVSKQDLMKK
jgi:alpha-L-arabinofuranosidase